MQHTLDTVAMPAATAPRSAPQRLATAFAIALGTVFALAGCEQSIVTRANEAAAVLRDFSISDTPIPEETMAGAQAIAVLREAEGGVVLGAGGGKGVMVHRTSKGWSAPVALDTTGGTIGAQIGANARDVVLVFRTEDEVEKVIASGSYSVAEAAATAGPAHGAALDADTTVIRFARVSGLYAGARVGGISFKLAEQVNRETYGMNTSVADILAGKAERPLGTSEFYKRLPAPR